MVHESPKTRPLTHRLIDRLQELGERPCLLTDDACWQSRPDIPQVLLVRNGDWMDNSAVRDQVAKWAAQERVFIDVAADIEQDRLIRGVQLADLVLACVRIPDCNSMLNRLRQMESREQEWRQKVALVWWLQESQMNVPWQPELDELASRDFKVSLDNPPPNSGMVLNHGVERIVHQLRGVCVGIALGGGAARGMAHLGVLKVLEQNGIIVDMIAGTSAGAMTGTLYASGLDLDYTVQSFVRDLTPGWFFRRLRHGGYWYLLYKYRRGQFDPMLRKYLSDLRLEQLPIPMNTVTVDLVSGKPLVRDRGDAVNGILESINLPGLSPPICRNGQALVDGGLVNNVPANVLVRKGCNFVIAVSVTAALEQEFANIRPGLNQKKYKAPSVIQTLMRGYLVQNVNMNSVGVQPADEIIDIDVTQFDLSEFTRTDELAAVGARTVEASMAHLLDSLSKLDGQLFRKNSPSVLDRDQKGLVGNREYGRSQASIE
jgi:predicted acylesterase/phospholipase RssA